MILDIYFLENIYWKIKKLIGCWEDPFLLLTLSGISTPFEFGDQTFAFSLVKEIKDEVFYTTLFPSIFLLSTDILAHFSFRCTFIFLCKSFYH